MKTSTIAKLLVKELPEDFPYRIALITRDTNYVLELPSYEIFIDDDNGFPLLIICVGLVSVIANNGRKTKYTHWSYQIYVKEFNKTIIEVFVSALKSKKALKISSNIYPTSEVFKFFPVLPRLNSLSKNRILGKENV